jgi:hypothetical protein
MQGLEVLPLRLRLWPGDSRLAGGGDRWGRLPEIR